MPKGVEHGSKIDDIKERVTVPITVMPKGVEHGESREWTGARVVTCQSQ